MGNITVGWGPTTWKGILAWAIWGLAALSTAVATIAGAVPQKEGIILSSVAGFLSLASHVVTAMARTLFAKYKAGVMPWEEDNVDPVPAVPTDVPASDVPATDPTN